MENKEIICYIDMFSLSQTAQIGDKKIQISNENIMENLKTLCQQEEIYTIHLYGNEPYIDGIVLNKILNYNNTEIEVKIN